MTPPVFSQDQVNEFLLSKQHLSEPAHEISLVQTVEDVGGLHATAATVPYLSLWARRTGFAKEELQAALYDERSLGKVLCMRNTLFILPKGLLPIVYQATRKRRDALMDRYLRHYGITRQQYEDCCADIKQLLGGAAKTTGQIKQELGDPSLTVVLDLMPNDWQLIRGRPRGTWRSNLHEYSTFEAWFPNVTLQSPTPEEAQVKLVKHYLSHFGPAIEEDVVWWTGLGKLEIRRALAAIEEVKEIEIDGLGTRYLILDADLNRLDRSHSIARSIILEPGLDSYIMGYKDRRRFLDPERHNQVFDRAGNALPTVWLDGHVIGVWLEDQKRSMVEVLLFEEPDKRVSVQVEAQAQCLGRFLEHDPVVVQIRLYPDDLYPKTPFTMARRQ